MIELVAAAGELQAFCEDRGYAFCFIGGLALLHWGEQRLTRDVDATVLTGFGTESSFVNAFLGQFRSRRPDARAFALENRVLLLTSSSGIPLDVALGALPFEAEAVARAREIEFTPDIRLRICTADDLVVMKAFADRPRDWADLEGILVRQQGRLDWTYIERQLQPLAEAREAPAILTRLADLRAAVGAEEGLG